MRDDSPGALPGLEASLAEAAAEQDQRAANVQAAGLMIRAHIARPSYGTPAVNVEGDSREFPRGALGLAQQPAAGGTMAVTSNIERLAARLGVETGSRKIGRPTLTRLSIYYAVVLLVVAGFIVLTDNMKGALLTTHAGGAPADAGLLVNDNPGWSHLARGFFAPLFRTLPPLLTGVAAVISSFLLA